MAQLERPQRHVEASSSTKTPTILTMEQLLRAGEASKPKLSPNNSTTSSSSPSSSSPSSPFFQRLRHHDSEDDHGQKKSVLTKVKEKARKLRHSLSKKKHEDGNPSSPTSVAGLEGDGVEEDAEYRGAPMYESEKAPEGYKENAKQHPRASPVIPEKHVMSGNDKPGMEQDREKTLTRSLSKKITQPATATPAAAAATLSGPNKTMTKTVTENNMKPAYAEGSETANSITSKIQGLTVSKPEEHHNSSSSRAAPATTHNTSLSIVPPRTPPAKMPSQTCSSAPPTSLAPLVTSPPRSPPASAPPSGKNASQIWDKGVSVKEYLMNKFEPGEDERALSRVISEAMSPRRTPGDAGVMEKVREAVTSLLRNEEPTKYVDAITAPASINTTQASSQIPASINTTHASSQVPPSTNTTRASSQVPVPSSNAQQVVQEENHGRILQAN